MTRPFGFRRPLRSAVLLSALALVAAPSFGQMQKAGKDRLDALAFTSDILAPSEPLVGLASVERSLPEPVRVSWAAFGASAKSEWRAVVDLRTGHVALAEGGNLPAYPGFGNRLRSEDIAGVLGGKAKPDLAVLDSITRGFLGRFAPLLGVAPRALRLNGGRSGQPASHVWFVDYDVVLGGLPLEGARVVFRYNNGNLVQWGSESLPSAGAVAPATRVTREEAVAVLDLYVGGLLESDTWIDKGTLHLLPANLAAPGEPAGYKLGAGRGMVKVWQITFRRQGVMGTWRARVDATSGELLELADVNDYAQVTGGVFLNSPTTGPQEFRGMPFADLSNGSDASSAGVYAGTSGGGSALAGKYVRIADTCGAIFQPADVNGNVSFGASAGTDCVTPAHGGAGNTRASRTQFFQVNRAMEAGRGWLPSNAFLQNQLLVNVNLDQTCNAYWSGSSLNFFKSGGGCNNSGEVAGISLHEFGHGLDQNDGTGAAPEGGTGEAYGDVTSAIALHNSCIGPGYSNGNCGGYGDACTACTGVRDIDFAKHAANTPATVSNFTATHCGTGSGPCGREVHCESRVPAEAIWDFANRDLPNPGTGSAWAVLDRLWYLSRGTATSAFACSPSGSSYTSNGCNAGSWWKTMRVVDDDDGNLANGTPHSCSLFAAFDRHGIACPSEAGASTCFSGCTPPAVPSLTLTAGDNAVTASLSGGGVFDLYRNETGCNAGFTKIANDLTSGSFLDLGVANTTTYYYQAVAQPLGNEACAGAPSPCQAITPAASLCAPPAAPTGLTVTSTSTTTVQLSWNASAGTAQYQVFRATSSTGPYTLIGTTTATVYGDGGLVCHKDYYYQVRAANSLTCASAATPTVATKTLACPCTTKTLYTSNFETGTGLAGWSTGTFGGTGTAADWRGIQLCTAHSGTKLFRFGGTSCTSGYANMDFAFTVVNGGAGIAVPAGSSSTRLTFWHRRSFESGYDGGTIAVSVDGANYAFVPASALTGATYNGAIFGTCGPAGTPGTPVFTGAQTGFQNTQVDLEAACNIVTGTSTGCAGRSVRIAFTTISDCSVVSSGWFLDDVTVTTCMP